MASNTPDKIVQNIQHPNVSQITLQILTDTFQMDYRLVEGLTGEDLARMAGMALKGADCIVGLMREDVAKVGVDIEEFNLELLKHRRP